MVDIIGAELKSMVSQILYIIPLLHCLSATFGSLIAFHVISISGNMLSFNVGSKEAFEVSLADVAQTQMQGKTDVVLEFHVDDTTGGNEVCGLSRYTFLCIQFRPYFIRCYFSVC